MSTEQSAMKKNFQSSRERILATASGGAALALSFVLSRIVIYRMPMGGSLTPASMLPLLLFAMAFGPVWGLGATFVMALLQLIGGYLLFPMQVVLDYILPFTAFGLVGFLWDKENHSRNILKRIAGISYIKAAIMTVICYLIQLTSSVLSGVIFYAEYAGDQNVWVYSITYNASFVIPECIITLVAMSAVFALARKAK